MVITLDSQGTSGLWCDGRSELELEGELDGARAADLVEGVEAAIRAARAEAVRKHLRGVAK